VQRASVVGTGEEVGAERTEDAAVARLTGGATRPTWQARVRLGAHRCGYASVWAQKRVQVGVRRHGWVRKNFAFGRNTLQITFFYFIVLPPYSLPKTYDGWVRREGQDGSKLSDKNFQLFLLLII
jgi:hypothetical protein